MQVMQADSKITGSEEEQEEYIQFRPSANFRNMKKFLKSRSDYMDGNPISMATYTVAPEAVEQQVAEKWGMKPTVAQPPLPPYPPPPDSPTVLKVTIKQEKEDNDTHCVEEEHNEPLIDQQLKPEKSENRPKRTMCKEFIRGECQRPVCRFSHELDLSQLRGVFTFCWNYQNARCTYSNCKFVHASIFEEAEFYRTGALPPHARRHLKKSLPLPQPHEENRNGILAPFANPPPASVPNLDKQPLTTCVAHNSIEQRTDEFNTSIIKRNLSPLKREWNEIDSSIGSSPRDIGTEHLAKKCKNCDIWEFRLQYYNEKMDNMVVTADELKKMQKKLITKSRKLSTVLEILMAPVSNTAAEKEKTILDRLSSLVHPNTGLNSNTAAGKEKTIMDDLSSLVNPNTNLNSNTAAEKEKTILDRLSSLVHPNTGLNSNTAAGKEKTIMDDLSSLVNPNTNLNNFNLMANLLRIQQTGEQTLSIDSSRET